MFLDSGRKFACQFQSTLTIHRFSFLRVAALALLGLWWLGTGFESSAQT